MTQPEVSPHVDKIDGAARESGESRNRVSDVILTVLRIESGWLAKSFPYCIPYE